MYLGSWKIEDFLTFPCNTNKVSGDAFDADENPAYRIYEDEEETPVATGTLTKQDDANTLGFYTERLQLLAATGFEKGKCYTIYIQATVDSKIGTMSHMFQIEAEVDANVVSDKTGYTTAVNQDKAGYTVSANQDKAGYSISGTKQTLDALQDITAASVWAVVVEGTKTALGFLRLILSAIALKSSGGGTPTLKSRDLADSKDRIVLTVDENGNRTNAELDEL